MRAATVLVLLATVSLCAADVDPEVSRLVDGFFSLFLWPCGKWVTLFSANASFSHPKFPHGVRGTAQLSAFCSAAQGNTATQQLFRADGPARITQTEAGVHLLIPYVWSAPLNGPDKPSFVNTGWEALQLVDGSIVAVTEFFNSNRTQL
jgi:hypothetical protein